MTIRGPAHTCQEPQAVLQNSVQVKTAPQKRHMGRKRSYFSPPLSGLSVPHKFLRSEVKNKMYYLTYKFFLLLIFLYQYSSSSPPYFLRKGISNILVFSFSPDLQLIKKHCGSYLQHMPKSTSLLLIPTVQIRVYIISSLTIATAIKVVSLPLVFLYYHPSSYCHPSSLSKIQINILLKILSTVPATAQHLFIFSGGI